MRVFSNPFKLRAVAASGIAGSLACRMFWRPPVESVRRRIPSLDRPEAAVRCR
jgi:hypothetical protein